MPLRMLGTRTAEFHQAIDFGFRLDPVFQFAADRETPALRPELRCFRDHAAPLLGRSGCSSFRTD